MNKFLIGSLGRSFNDCAVLTREPYDRLTVGAIGVAPVRPWKLDRLTAIPTLMLQSVHDIADILDEDIAEVGDAERSIPLTWVAKGPLFCPIVLLRSEPLLLTVDGDPEAVLLWLERRCGTYEAWRVEIHRRPFDGPPMVLTTMDGPPWEMIDGQAQADA